MKLIQTKIFLVLAALATVAGDALATPETPYHVAWMRQLGTGAYDFSYGVSADHLGNVYISGETSGSLGGPNAGSYDAFVSKYDAEGNLLWTRQLGTNDWDGSSGVSADVLGNVYISGRTNGWLAGPNAGEYDAFVSKYNADGNLLWTRQLGTDGSDKSLGVSADGDGNVYISGETTGSLGGPHAGGWDAFVVRLAEECPYALVGDLNDDCKVDFADCALIAAEWLIDGDFSDFAKMAINWLTNCYLNPGEPACVPK